MEKKKILFYYEEAVEAWIPAPNELDCIVSIDNLEVDETQTVKFKVFEMTEEELSNLPEC